MPMSRKQVFALGYALGCFAHDDYDEGLHAILPCTDDNGLPINQVFERLEQELLAGIHAQASREALIDIINKFAADHNISPV